MPPWRKVSNSKFVATGIGFDRVESVRYNLVIKRNRDDSDDWTWTATCMSSRTLISRQGVAPTALKAMRAAQDEIGPISPA